jgi:uncharacterized protein (DUF488 family)
VRRFPGSRRHPHFSRQSLEQGLPAAGIRYVWEGDRLGGWRRARRDSPHTAIEAEGFRGYADHMETELFRRGVESLLALAIESPAAVMCAERLPWRCHRFFLADYLVLRGVQVIHVIETRQLQEHRMNPMARREGERLVYDRKSLAPSGSGSEALRI